MRLYVEVYGCTQNQGEARLMATEARSKGHILVGDETSADACLLVTCTVIEHTERRMLKRMRALSSTEKPLIVAGCMAAAQRKRVLEAAPNAMLLPPRKWMEIASLLGEGTVCAERVGEVESTEITSCDAIIPIAQGCMGNCTYCITRIARGRVTTYPVDVLVQQIEGHLASGAKEVKLTGQDTAAYGKDKDTNLAHLLRRVVSLPGEFRVRVGMMDPLTVLPILDELVEAYDSPKIYKFLHLPLQSGDDDILGLMRREYTISDFIDIVRTFRKSFSELTLSTDIIVGFPGESYEQFRRSFDVVQRVKPDIVNVTRFSAREGTPAVAFPGRVVGWKVKEWSRELTALKARISTEINRRYEGRVMECLMTERGKNGTTLARTNNYKQVVLEGRFPLGTFRKVRIRTGREADLIGEPAS